MSRVLHAFACFNKDQSIRRTSTSGGIFTALSSYIIRELHGVVYGVSFDENFNAYHRPVESVKELDFLRGSKYSQSRLGNSFSEIKKTLDNNRVVLFSGTPCQNYGLKAFLKKDYENLYTMDFICHGVGSPLLWKYYVSHLATKGKISKIVFKEKTKGWKHWYFTVYYDNGKKWARRGNMSAFMKAYLRNDCLRPSCHNCRFKGLDRETDFTISDCWGIGEQDPINDDKGLSALLINSNKGNELFERIKDEIVYKEFDALELMHENWTTFKSSPIGNKRSSLFVQTNKDKNADPLIAMESPTIKDWIVFYKNKLKGSEL